MRNRKAQSWMLDFVVGLLLFTATLVLSVKLVVNLNTDDGFEDIRDEAEYLSEVILSQGYPENWSNNTVVRPGILTNGTLDEVKFAQLDNLSYPVLKSLLNARYDFGFYLLNATDQIVIPGQTNTSYVGYPGLPQNVTSASVVQDISVPDAVTIVTVDRLLLYQNTLLRMVWYVWE